MEDEQRDTDQEMTLEEAFSRLDSLIEKLQDRQTPLEEAFAAYQEGVKLLKVCSDRIDLVEKKVVVLSEDGSTRQLEEMQQ